MTGSHNHHHTHVQAWHWEIDDPQGVLIEARREVLALGVKAVRDLLGRNGGNERQAIAELLAGWQLLGNGHLVPELLAVAILQLATEPNPAPRGDDVPVGGVDPVPHCGNPECSFCGSLGSSEKVTTYERGAGINA